MQQDRRGYLEGAGEATGRLVIVAVSGEIH